MRISIKKLLILLTSLVGVLLILALLAILYALNWDPNKHKEWIASAFEERTGHSLTLGGVVEFSIYPWLGLTLNEVSVGNGPGFSAEPLFQAERLEARIRLSPMLNREYEIDALLLQGVRINLEVNEAGEANWTNLTGVAGGARGEGRGENAEAQASPRASDAPAGRPAFNRLAVGGVAIQDASLSFAAPADGRQYEIADLNASSGELVYGQPIDLALSFSAAASQPPLAARIMLAGTVNYDLDNQRYDLSPLRLDATLTGADVPGGSAEIALNAALGIDLAEDLLTLRDLSLSALGAQLNANANGYGILGKAPTYQLNMAAAGNDLAPLFRVLDLDDLAARAEALPDGAFNMAALLEVSPAGGNLRISDLEAELLGASLAGDLGASGLNTDAPLLLQGRIDAVGADLPAVLDLVGRLQGGQGLLSRYGAELPGMPDQSFRLEAVFDADLAAGNIAVPVLDAHLLGAEIEGNFTAVGLQSEAPLVSGELSAEGPDLALLMDLAGQVTSDGESALSQYGERLRNGLDDRRFTVDADFEADWVRGNVEVSRLHANFFGFSVNGRLAGRSLNDQGSLDGELNLTGEQVGEVLRAIGRERLGAAVQTLSLRMAARGDGGEVVISPMGLEVAFAGGQFSASPAILAFNADARLDLENRALQMDDLRLAGLGLELSGDLAVEESAEDFHYSGRLAASPFNLRDLARQLGQELPAAFGPDALQTLAFSTALRGSRDDLLLEALELHLDDSLMAGSFALKDFASPDYDFNIAIDRLDVDRYRQAGAASAASGTGDAAFALESLRDLNLRGKVGIGELGIYNLDFANVELSLAAADGEISLSPMTADLYQGSYHGELRLNLEGETPAASLEASLNEVALAPLLEDFRGASHVSGVGKVQFSLTGRGGNAQEIKSNLNGIGHLELRDGVLYGINVGGVLNQVEAMIRSQRVQGVQRGEQTPFDDFSATLDIRNGIVSSDDLIIESPGFRIAGHGTLVNLADNSIAYDLRATVDRVTAVLGEQEYDVGGYIVPISCTGALASPRCLPKVEGLVQAAISTLMRQGVGGILLRTLEEELLPRVGLPRDQAGPAAAEGQEEIQDEAQREEQEQEEEGDSEENLLNRALEGLLNL